MRRAIFLPPFVLLLAFSFGCAPSSTSVETPSASSTAPPEITDDMIRKRINYAYIRKVPEENGAGEPIS